jgi:ferredoxin-NADP reductase
VTSLYLTAENGGHLPEPRAGQYITLRAVEAGDPPPVRSYSLSSTSRDTDCYRISVKREPQGMVSAYLHTQLRPGTILEVAAPRGQFVLTDEPTPALLISAGIGVTPVLAMLHELAAAHSMREVWWLHTAGDANQHSFAGEAHQLLQSLPRAHERIFYTSAETDPPRTSPVIRGRRHSPHSAASPAGERKSYVCGPTAFMTDMHDALLDLGITPDRVHTELFGALPAVNPGVTDTQRATPHQPPGPPGAGPQITFARSGLPFAGRAAIGRY